MTTDLQLLRSGAKYFVSRKLHILFQIFADFEVTSDDVDMIDHIK